MDGLTPEEFKEVAKLQREREALMEKVRSIDTTISHILGISANKTPKKNMSSRDFLAACS